MTLFLSLLLALTPVVLLPGSDRVELAAGPWQFYPGELLEPGDPRWQSSLVRTVVLPASWNQDSWNGKPSGRPEGQGTYRITVDRGPAPGAGSLGWTLAGSAARVLINGKEAARIGVLGSSERGEVPANRPQIIPLGTSQQVEIVVQVTNHHHVDGGLWAPLSQGPTEVLVREESVSRAWDLLLAGACLLLGLVALAIGILLKSMSPLFWFGVTCINLGFRILVHGHYSIYLLFPDWDWQLFQKVRHWTMYLGILSFLLLLDSLFPKGMRPWFLKTAVAVSALLGLVVLVLPYRWFGDLLYPFTVWAAVQMVYAVRVLWKYRKEAETYQVPVLVGLGVLLAGSAVEFLRVVLFIPLPETLPLAAILLVVLMGIGVGIHQLGLFRRIGVLNSTKDTMLSIIAHDLRGPIHSASRYVNKHLLPDTVKLEEKKEAIKILATTLDRSGTLLEALLSWSLSQSGRLVLHPQVLAARDLVLEAAEDLEKIRAAKNLSLSVAPENPSLRADRPTAVTVLRNLLSNAYKFTPPGGLISVDFRQKPFSTVIEVRDTGVGLTPENLRRVLSPHEKIVTAGTEGESGSGFGLFLCQELLRVNGGKLDAVSQEGRGSAFSASFPREQSALLDQGTAFR